MPMPDQDLTRGHAAGIARGAAVIAGLTVLSRILGLVRTLVFSQRVGARSEEHTSELQSQSNLVCRLLLEKKKNKRVQARHGPHESDHTDLVDMFVHDT